ncbi:MAG: hypothetical protein U0835_17405 [Isosphaeraceae bacterium]
MTLPVVLTLTLIGAAPPSAVESWEPQVSGTKARFRGVSAVDHRVVWASGTLGTFCRTTDGGDTWTSAHVEGAKDLDFRDVQAFDDRTAVLLSSGPGEQSRIYRTEDGGATWSLRLKNPDADGFLDAIAFFDRKTGLAMGDPVRGRFQVFRTEDGGVSWAPIDPEGMPPARKGEGGFAASGTCLVTLRGTRRAWFASGGVAGARVFRTEDGGRHWSVAETPVRSDNASSGIFSLGFRDPEHGLAIGGDYAKPAQTGPYLARSDDGGRTWKPVESGPAGYRSCLRLVDTDPGRPIWLAAGPTGTDISRDDGKTWNALGTTGYHAMSSAPGGPRVWAVGDEGRIGCLTLEPPTLRSPPRR